MKLTVAIAAAVVAVAVAADAGVVAVIPKMTTTFVLVEKTRLDPLLKLKMCHFDTAQNLQLKTLEQVRFMLTFALACNTHFFEHLTLTADAVGCRSLARSASPHADHVVVHVQAALGEEGSASPFCSSL